MDNKKLTFRIGDFVAITVPLYIYEYDINSHHFCCTVETDDPSEDTLVYVPVDIRLFNYKKPPQIRFKLPSNFNPYPQTLQGKGKNLFKPFPDPEFELNGKVRWECTTDPEETFICTEGVRDVQDTDVYKHQGNYIRRNTVKGIINRIFKKRLGTYGDDPPEGVMYVDSVSRYAEQNHVAKIFNKFIAVILIEDWEIYIPTYMLIESKNKTKTRKDEEE